MQPGVGRDGPGRRAAAGAHQGDAAARVASSGAISMFRAAATSSLDVYKRQLFQSYFPAKLGIYAPLEGHRADNIPKGALLFTSWYFCYP